MQIEWVHPITFVSKKTAIIFTCIELLISVHDDRHFSANGFVTVGPMAMTFLRD